MAQTRILQRSDMYSKRAVRSQTIIEVLCIAALSPLACWLDIGCIEWASVALGRW